MSYKDKNKEKTNRQKHYLKHRDEYIQRAKKQKAKIKEHIDALKSSGCALCGETCIPCLEFHHLDPFQKDFSISQVTVKGNFSKIKDEIAKCVLLCANCHRKVHYGLIDLSSYHKAD